MSLGDFEYNFFFKNVYDKAMERDIFSDSAQIAFYFIFALFPLLIFLTSLFGLVLESADDLRTQLFFYLQQVMPASAYELVESTLQEVTTGSSGGKLTLGLLIALWSASVGIDNIRLGLNSVYNLKEERSWIKARGLSVLSTFALAVLLTIALGSIFYGSKLLSMLLQAINLPISSPFIITTLQIIILLAVMILIFALIYNFLPNHKKPYKWVWVSPGAIAGIVLWLMLSGGFRLYLSYFNSYNATYGSLGAMIILLLWLYLTAAVILIGGTVNAVLQEMTAPETVGEEVTREEANSGKDESKDKKENKENKEKEIEQKKPGASTVLVNKSNTRKQPRLAAANSFSADDSDRSSMENYANDPELKNKSWVNLAVGGLFGVLVGLFIKREKK
jgi:membrane protein